MSAPQNLLDFLVTKGNGVKGLSELNLKKVPNEFIQPLHERFDSIQVVNDKNIPIIDVSEWNDPKSICEAASTWGFFQIINHGIPMDVLEDVKKASHSFFDLPVEERRKYLKENTPTPSVVLKSSFSTSTEKFMDWKDHLVHTVTSTQQTNQEDFELWPTVSRDPVVKYVNYAKPIIRKLLEVLLHGINVTNIDAAKESAVMGTLMISLLYYPICPNPDLAVGSGRHSDISSITLLLQDDVGGLYVRDNEGDRWIHVKPMKGSLIVNIGDTLQILSNDKYKSNEHRVFLTGSENRVSVPIFANASKDTFIGPLPEVLENREEAIYKQVRFSDYFDNFLSKGQDGKLAMNFAKK